MGAQYSPTMQRIALAASILLAGCPGDDTSTTCGPGDAGPSLIVAPEAGASFAYGGFTAHDNGDCPDPSAPTVRSLTLFGSSPSGDTFALCIARPDKLAGGLAVQSDTTTDGVQLVTMKGTANGCSYKLDFAAGSSGTLTGSGVCMAGLDAGGFAIDVDVAATLDKTCGTDPATMLPVAISGTVAVAFVPAS
jgi:hypothetical protein